MALRAKKPEALAKRLKMLMFGKAGVGKTTAAIQFPRAYVIDCEKGTDNYSRLINEMGGEVFQTNEMAEIIREVRSLATERHDFRTLVIDPATTAYNDLIDRCESQVGTKYGAHVKEANKSMRKLFNLLTSLDMNVVMTCHSQTEYSSDQKKMEVIGETFDGWKKLDYLFDLVIEIGRDPSFDPKSKARGGKVRYGRVAKTRIDTFPDGEVFEWSYEEVRRRYDASVLERQAQALPAATAEQVAQLRGLLEVVKLPEGTQETWLSKASVERFEDMPGEYVARCIEYVQKRLPAAPA